MWCLNTLNCIKGHCGLAVSKTLYFVELSKVEWSNFTQICCCGCWVPGPSGQLSLVGWPCLCHQSSSHKDTSAHLWIQIVPVRPSNKIYEFYFNNKSTSVQDMSNTTWHSNVLHIKISVLNTLLEMTTLGWLTRCVIELSLQLKVQTQAEILTK